LEDAALALACRIATRAPLAVEAAKQSIGRALDLTATEAAAADAPDIAVLRASRDHAEAIAAFRERRSPAFNRS